MTFWLSGERSLPFGLLVSESRGKKRGHDDWSSDMARDEKMKKDEGLHKVMQTGVSRFYFIS